jgi:hypothetical protein
VSIGFDEGSFWTLTPRQIARATAGRNEQLRLEHNSRVTAAYYGGLAPHAKKTPKLDELLIKPFRPQRRRRQTVQQQIAVARQWTAVIEAQPKRKTNGGK